MLRKSVFKMACSALCLSSAMGTALAQANCDLEAVRCIGDGAEYDTSSSAGASAAFQAAANDAVAGDRLKIMGGIYYHDALNDFSNTFLSVSASGSAISPITIEPFDSSPVSIVGFGFPEGTAGPARRDERLIVVRGDHVVIRGIELSNSTRNGLVIQGDHGRFEDLKIHDNWMSNVLVLSDGPIEGNRITRIETYRSRHGSGIWVVPSSGSPDFIRDTIIEDSLSYRNGFQPDGNKVPPVSGDSKGGGNSDGFGVFKTCHEHAYRKSADNLCTGTKLINNIAWGNADDGFDHSGAGNNALIENISFANGPEGNRAFKVYARVKGGLDIIGNVGFMEDTIGFELQFNGAGRVINNTSLASGSRGYNVIFENTTQETGAFTNNLSALNLSNTDWRVDAVDDATYAAGGNFRERRDGDPLLSDQDLAAILRDADYAGSFSGAGQKFQYIRHRVLEALSPATDSPLVDAGVVVPGIHCAAPNSGVLPPYSEQNCVAWAGSAPDIGGVELGDRDGDATQPPSDGGTEEPYPGCPAPDDYSGGLGGLVN